MSWLDDDWINHIDDYEPVVVEDPYQYVLGLDPGGTTGVACLRIDTRDEKAKPELIYLHQIADGRYGFKTFFNGSTIAENVTVVSEKWKERNIKGADREPQYIEGGIHMLWGDENVVWQYPDQKELIPDDFLKKNNLWTEGKRHQMDALKHALAYLRNEGHSGTLDSLTDESGEAEPIAQPGQADASQLDQGQGESGDGEAEGGAPGNMQEIMEAIQALAEAAAEAGEATGSHTPTAEEMQAAAEAYNGTQDAPEDTRKRTKRERNGAFAGFNPAEESGGVTLLDD